MTLTRSDVRYQLDREIFTHPLKHTGKIHLRDKSKGDFRGSQHSTIPVIFMVSCYRI
jgi:hypothetical protein